jgi:hypothetical protein
MEQESKSPIAAFLETKICASKYHTRLNGTQYYLVSENLMNSTLETVAKMEAISLEETLIHFQLFLHQKELINNYDWDFEAVAKQFMRAERKNKKSKGLPPNS